MSRIIVFGLNNQSVGEIRAILKRGWAISSGGNTSIVLPADMAAQSWIQIGHCVFVDHPKLGGWAGVIDCPWGATPPVTLTLYDIPYLLSLRSPEAEETLSGTISELVTQLVAMANGFEDLFIEVGKIDVDTTVREFELKVSPIWEQLLKLVGDAGMELMFRSMIGADNKLVTYIDVSAALGKDTGFLLQDGEGGNATFSSAQVTGDIWNRVTGQTGESTTPSQLTSGPIYDKASMRKYRLRNTVTTLESLEQSELDEDTEAFLEYYKAPRLTLTVEVKVSGVAAGHLRLGNTVRIRSTRLVLPGGRRGWEGEARIMALSYDEGRGLVSMTVEGEL